MNPELELTSKEESIREDGMLFVRTDSILETMVKMHLIIAGLIIAIIVMPIQTSFRLYSNS